MTTETILVDFVALAENEIQRVKTGYAPGPSMRDPRGQKSPRRSVEPA